MLERPISKTGWTRVAFGDVVRLSKARVADPEAAGIERVVGLEHVEPGDLRIRRWGDVADGTTFTTLFKPGQVLFGKRRAYQRKVAVADFEGVCSGDIYVLEPANDQLLPDLLPFLCQTDAFFDHAVGTSAGSLSPRTNWSSLAGFEFHLPPLEEQARLADLLRYANAYVSRLASLSEMRNKLVNSLLNQTWIQFRDRCLLGDIILSGPKNGIYKPSSSYGTGVRIVRIDSFKAGTLSDEARWKRVRLEEDELKDFRLAERDILINRVNSRDLVGQAVFVRKLEEPAVFESNIMRLRLDENLTLPYLICAQLNHPRVRRQISERRKDAVNQSSINQNDVRSLSLPRLNLAIQSQFMDAIAEINRKLDEVHVRRIEVQRMSLLVANMLIDS